MNIKPTAQPATVPLPQIWQALLDRLEKPQGIEQATAPAIDFRTFLAALQDTARHSAQAAQDATQSSPLPADWMPLDKETRTHVTTAVMCRHLARKEQTARIWAMRQTGPLQAIRVNGRLMWPVSSIRKLLGVS